MKGNKVRMNISRDMHEWFTAIDGDTNDERMQRVIDDVAEYKARAGSAESSLINYRVMHGAAVNHVCKLKRENSTLKKMLALSVVISWSAAICLAYVQGWFV